jgi:hypothetical protein
MEEVETKTKTYTPAARSASGLYPLVKVGVGVEVGVED